MGEYVEFTLDTNCEGTHSEQAVNVTGIKGKELQCDFIHRLNKKKKISKSDKKSDDDDDKLILMITVVTVNQIKFKNKLYQYLI